MGFEGLYELYAGTVYGFLMFKLNDEELAEDILQDTFLAVYQGIHTLHTIESPKAWILAIAHNKMVDHLRKKQLVEQSHVIEQLSDVSIEGATNLFIEEILNQLNDPDRTIVYGLYVEGLSCLELAQILQIPEGTVKSKAHYARKRLRKWLREGST
mgnify:FL=1